MPLNLSTKPLSGSNIDQNTSSSSSSLHEDHLRSTPPPSSPPGYTSSALLGHPQTHHHPNSTIIWSPASMCEKEGKGSISGDERAGGSHIGITRDDPIVKKFKYERRSSFHRAQHHHHQELLEHERRLSIISGHSTSQTPPSPVLTRIPSGTPDVGQIYSRFHQQHSAQHLQHRTSREFDFFSTSSVSTPQTKAATESGGGSANIGDFYNAISNNNNSNKFSNNNSNNSSRNSSGCSVKSETESARPDSTAMLVHGGDMVTTIRGCDSEEKRRERSFQVSNWFEFIWLFSLFIRGEMNGRIYFFRSKNWDCKLDLMCWFKLSTDNFCIKDSLSRHSIPWGMTSLSIFKIC